MNDTLLINHMVLIDPFENKVDSIILDRPEIDGNLLRHNIGCNTLARVQLNNSIDLWVDDEGLFAQDQQFFAIGSYPNPIAGKGLVTGLSGPDTVSLPSTITATDIARFVRFIGDQYDLENFIEMGHIQRPHSGMMDPDTGEVSVFWQWTAQPREDA
ncbi:MAG: DUF3846 domain-containing protein [Nitratireductor sp.]|nr:DUF3846 domain-containing protein [Nitratireductor sp.]